MFFLYFYIIFLILSNKQLSYNIEKENHYHDDITEMCKNKCFTCVI